MTEADDWIQSLIFRYTQGVILRGDSGDVIHMLCKIDEGQPTMNNSTLRRLAPISLGKFRQIGRRQSQCILFDTGLTYFERMAILKHNGETDRQTQ